MSDKGFLVTLFIEHQLEALQLAIRVDPFDADIPFTLVIFIQPFFQGRRRVGSVVDQTERPGTPLISRAPFAILTIFSQYPT